MIKNRGGYDENPTSFLVSVCEAQPIECEADKRAQKRESNHLIYREFSIEADEVSAWRALQTIEGLALLPRADLPFSPVLP